MSEERRRGICRRINHRPPERTSSPFLRSGAILRDEYKDGQVLSSLPCDDSFGPRGVRCVRKLSMGGRFHGAREVAAGAHEEKDITPLLCVLAGLAQVSRYSRSSTSP
jgi:hypothetical protein